MLKASLKGNRLSVSGELKVQHLDEIRPALLEALDLPQDVVLDVSRVAEVDTAGLQLVLSFLRTRQEGSARLEGLTPSFDRALQLTGLEPFFQAYAA